ncbi:MAG: methyltransferase domain-containing protein [Actinomycetota bacterium]|nr:methyltransferase domain-containing protein [Actinomycetota bacterium]
MTIPDIAAQGYELGGDDYERARPSYPPQAVDLLVGELEIGPGSTVLDLGAGTGKLTRLLRPTGATLVAVEPVEAMRRHLAAVADVQVLEGTAEAIPLADASIDSVVVGTAFHWFRGDQALAEIVRVLKPEGGLGLVWNNPDLDVDWVAEIWDLIGTKRRSAPRNRDLSWKEAFASAPGLTPLRHRRFSHAQQLGIDGLIARVHSIAFVASLPPAEREDLLERVREIASSHPGLAGGDRLALPYRTDVYWCRRA